MAKNKKISNIYVQERRKREAEFAKKNNRYTTSTSAKLFPIVIVLVVLISMGVVFYLFNTYKNTITISQSGYFLSSKYDLEDLKKNSLEFNSKLIPDTVETVQMENGDGVYKTPLNHFFDNTKTNEIDMQYPLFANDGLAIINYNDDINIITTDFIRYEGYEGLILSYGKAYDEHKYTQIDDFNYLVLSYSNGLFINLYDVKIKTKDETFEIPVNSILYFTKESINLYEREKDNTLKKNQINGISLEDTISFYYDGTKEEYEYTYEEFLEGVGTLYIAKEVEKVIEEPVVEEKPTLPEKKKVEETRIVDDFVWEEPKVTVSNVKVKAYSMAGDITVSDPAHVIVKEPTFTFELDGKQVLRRSYSGSRYFSIAGLLSDTEYRVIGTYTYLDEDMETKRIVKFYDETIKTKSLDDLENIELSFDYGEIYSKKIILKDVHIISDLDSESLNGVNKAAFIVDGTSFNLSYSQVTAFLNGSSVDIESSASLKSNANHDFVIKFYDKAGNELNTIGNTGSVQTSKINPSVSLSLVKREIDQVTVGIKLQNDDDVVINNYQYIVKNISGTIVTSGEVNEENINLTNLDPNGIYSFLVTGDIDTNDGNGIKDNYELGRMEFSTLALSSLGFMNLYIEKGDIVNDSVNFNVNINLTKTNKILIKLLQKVELNLIDNETKEAVAKVTLDADDERFEQFKNGESIPIEITGLSSNKTYTLKTKSFAKQGNETYTNDCIVNETSFETRKNSALASVTNMLISETMVDFDVQIIDTDKAIISNFARVELRDEYGNLINSSKVGINQTDATRLTYNNLTPYKYYTILIFVDEYNETSLSDTYETNYSLTTPSSGIQIFTEEGISGSIELIDSKRQAQSKNIADVNSNLKWIENANYYTLHHTVDEQDHLHIYSRKGASSYIYDLSEYWGRTVRVSFKIKTITPTKSGALYLTNYLTGTTSTQYSYKIESSTSSWKTISYNFVVGSYNYSSNGANYYSHTSTSYGKSYTGGVGFYISGGTTDLAEYEIKDFMIELYPEIEMYNSEKDVKKGEKPYEQGYYDNSGKKVNSSLTTYVRYAKPIEIKESGYYRFDFSNYLTTEYTAYFKIYNENNTAYKQFNDYRSGDNIYIPEGKKVAIYFRRAQGNLSPEYDEATGTVNGLNLVVKRVDGAQQVASTTYDYKKFDYKLNTNVRISVKIAETLKKYSTGEYYIRAYHGSTYDEYKFDDLKSINSVTGIVKTIPLAENTEYKIGLGIIVNGRYYELDTFDVNTSGEVGSINNANDFRWIQPYGNYVILNDIDFTDKTYYIGYEVNPHNGTIDFQGYHAKINTVNYDSMRKVYFLGKDGLIKNLVLDIHLTHTTGLNLYGFVMYNYGTTDGLYMNIYDDREEVTKDSMLALYSYSTYKDSVIKNFVININNDIEVYDDTSLLVYYARGKIQSGYVYGKDMVVNTELRSGDNYRRVTMLEAYGYSQSEVSDVYSLSSIKYQTSFAYDVGGVLVYDTYGTVKNAYVIGEANPLLNTRGPVVAYLNNSATTDNIYYMSENYYEGTYQNRIYPVALNNSAFQNSVLTKGFNIDEMLELGYYPHVIFDSARMPQQPYIELPKNTEEEIDIVSWSVKEKTNDTATLEMIINNPYGEDIVSVAISDVESEVLSQKFENGNTYLTLKLKNPKVYQSKYVIRNIKSRYGDFSTTKTFTEGEKYVLVDLYREVKTIDDWKVINTKPKENYILMNDLNFYGESKYFISNFYGKLNGNNHTIKNIEVNGSYYGLINYLYGEISNLKVDGLKKNVSGALTYVGLIGHTPKNSKLENVHVRNVEITIPTKTTGTIYVGGVVGYANSARFSHVSATNVKITSDAEVSNIYIGGVAGRFYSGHLLDSYAANVDINITNAFNAKGVGGLVGAQDAGSDGNIIDCYSTGSISTNTTNVGGLVGTVYGFVESSFSTVNIISDMGYLGGITGYLNSESLMNNTFYAGSISSNAFDVPIGRIAGNMLAKGTHYSYSDTQIYGSSSYETYGESVLTYDELLNGDTYNNIIGLSDHFDVSRVNEGILPQLLSSDMENLDPYQLDEELFMDELYITVQEVNKRTDDATVVIKIDNPNHYTIKDVQVGQMDVTIQKNQQAGNDTLIQMIVTPQKAFDNYLINKLVYEDENGNEKTINKSSVITMSFYNYINNLDDFANIGSDYSENYFLTTDLDYTDYDMTKMKTSKAINRLESSSSTKHTIKGIHFTSTTKANYQGLIKTIGTKMENIIFEDYSYTNTTTGEHTYMNLINLNYGSIVNCEFNNITINTPNKSYVGIIGLNDGTLIDNISIDTTKIKGKNYIGSLITTQNSTNTRVITHIDAIDLDVYGSGNYVGGLFGYFYNVIDSKGGSTIYYPTAYINVTSSVKDPDNSKTKIYGGGSYIGGVAGIGDCEYCDIGYVNVTGKSSYTGGVSGQSQAYYHYHTQIHDSVVSGVNYVGGYAGYGRYIRYAYLNNMHVIGTSASGKGVGGIIGNTGYSEYYCTIENSLIENSGIYTGGIVGYANGAGIYYETIQNNVRLNGSDYVGGITGYQLSTTTGYNTVYDITINASGNYAGGLSGYIDNRDVTSGTQYDNLVTGANIKANAFAGGFWGGKSKNFNNTNYSLYFDGNIVTNDINKAGFTTGDPTDLNGYYARSIGFYEGSKINGKTIKTYMEEANEEAGLVNGVDPNAETITIDTFYDGYLEPSTNVVSTNYSYVYATYSDLYEFDAGKVYNFKVNFPKLTMSGPIYQIFIYNRDGKYVGTSASSTAYFDNPFSTTYTGSGTMRAIKDGYYRIMIYDSRYVSNVEVTSSLTNKYGIRSSQLYSADIIRNRLTWTSYVSNSNNTQYDPIGLGFHNTVFNYEGLGSAENNFVVNDDSGNGHTLSGNISSVSTEGMYFDYKDDYLLTEGIKVGNNFTATVKFRHTNTSTGFLFSYGASNKERIAINTGTYGMYLRLNGSSRYLNVDIPVRDNATLTITYTASSGAIKIYVDGIYKTSVTYKTSINGADTDIMYLGRDIANSYKYMGLISDVQIYNRVLEESEIATNYQTGTVSNTNDLVVHYDLTKYKHTKTGYYPELVESNTANYQMNPKVYTPMPTELPKYYDLTGVSSAVQGVSMSIDSSVLDSTSDQIVATSSIEGKYHVYASGINAVNVEFDELTDDLFFKYKNNEGIYETVDVDKRVYTLYYDYNHDLELEFGTSIETIKKTYTKDELAKTMYIKDNKYYYINNGNLYEKNSLLKENVVNLYNGYALTSDSKLYDISTGKENSITINNTLASSALPIYENYYNDSLVKTYYNFSIISDKDNAILREGQYFVKDNNIYIFESDNLNNNIVFNTYNEKTYEFALGKDNTIKVYGELLKSKDYLPNEFVTEIIGNNDNNEPIMMIRYIDGNVRVLNYETGKVLFTLGNNEDVSFITYLVDAFSTTKIKKVNSSSYNSSKKLVKKIVNTNDSEIINELIDEEIVNSTKEGTKINNNISNYVMSYDSVTDTYNIYNTEEVFNTNIATDELETKNEKIDNSRFLTEYYYGKKSNSIIRNYKLYIYLGILVIVLINLYIFSRRFIKKNEKAN